MYKKNNKHGFLDIKNTVAVIKQNKHFFKKRKTRDKSEQHLKFIQFYFSYYGKQYCDTTYTSTKKLPFTPTVKHAAVTTDTFFLFSICKK